MEGFILLEILLRCGGPRLLRCLVLSHICELHTVLSVPRVVTGGPRYLTAPRGYKVIHCPGYYRIVVDGDVE